MVQAVLQALIQWQEWCSCHIWPANKEAPFSVSLQQILFSLHYGRNRKTIPPRQRCYHNWSHSSTAMEADITSKGLAQSEIQHGVRYLCLIGDGDSSVSANITTSTSYGVYVQKLECANHACKGYCSRLKKLAKDHPGFHGQGGLTKLVIQRLTVGARIRKHSKTGNGEYLSIYLSIYLYIYIICVPTHNRNNEFIL